MMTEVFLDGHPSDPDTYVVWEGLGERVNLMPLEGIIGQVLNSILHNPLGNKDLVEGRLCGPIHKALVGLEDECFEALDDPGFWAYLGFKYLDEFVRWRESAIGDYTETPEPKTLSNALVYFYDPTLKEGVLSRMYMRGHIANQNGDYDLAEGRDFGGNKRGSTDLWRSHVTRVKTAESPDLAKALARYWSENEWIATETPRGGLRALAKLINRRRSNIVGIVLDADESREVIAQHADMISRTGE